jgi:hypothetical protein
VGGKSPDMNKIERGKSREKIKNQKRKKSKIKNHLSAGARCSGPIRLVSYITQQMISVKQLG